MMYVCPEHQREMGEGARRVRGRGASGDSGKYSPMPHDSESVRLERYTEFLYVSLLCYTTYEKIHTV